MPRTFRELLWAYRGHEYAEWERTAQIWAVIAETNRDHKRRARPFSPFDLFRRPGRRSTPRGIPLTGDALRAMKPLFVKKRDA
jgi:hypothetical protein